MPALFLRNVIAVIWDFDKTLTPGYMQAPLFRHYGVSEARFWEEVEGLEPFYRGHGTHRVARDALYLNHILEYVRAGRFGGLTNRLLRELGAEIEFFPGLPEFFDTLRDLVSTEPEFARHDVKLEHYIVSTGLREMILGSAIGSHVDDVWACEFIEARHPPDYDRTAAPMFPETGPPAIAQIGYAIDNTSKTRAIFEINKGSNKLDIDVNASIKPEMRRVPFENMIYVADGPSDIPAFSVVLSQGGKTFGVYDRSSPAHFEQINDLQRQGRILAFGEADYRPGTQAALWLTSEVRRTARQIAAEREQLLQVSLGQPARHIVQALPARGAAPAIDAPIAAAAAPSDVGGTAVQPVLLDVPVAPGPSGRRRPIRPSARHQTPGETMATAASSSTEGDRAGLAAADRTRPAAEAGEAGKADLTPEPDAIAPTSRTT